LQIIEKSSKFACCFKPNSAFFEALGPDGIRALQEVIASIPSDIPVILDVKRGDIETTAQAYATAAYEISNAGAVTISPYMGWDSVSPFLDPSKGKAVFILCKTSNPSSKVSQPSHATRTISNIHMISP
jgi:orotidine 5'-phosphate decarboxylase subfamily 2